MSHTPAPGTPGAPRTYHKHERHRDSLQGLESALGHQFREPQLLHCAVTHRSYANEMDVRPEDNQRLEFLGDAVLGLVTAHALFERDPEAPEGSLSARQSQVVCEGSLARIARDHLELGAYLRLGRGEGMTGGRDKPSLLADAYEACLAAIFLDAGLDVVRETILRLHGPLLDDVSREGESAPGVSDYKSALQRLVQGSTQLRPHYEVVEENGPSHSRTFVSQVRVEGRVVGRGTGRSKKQAEQQAARRAMEWFDENPLDGSQNADEAGAGQASRNLSQALAREPARPPSPREDGAS